MIIYLGRVVAYLWNLSGVETPVLPERRKEPGSFLNGSFLQAESSIWAHVMQGQRRTEMGKKEIGYERWLLIG